MIGDRKNFTKITIEDTNEECWLDVIKEEKRYKCVLIDSYNSRYIGYGATNILAIEDCFSSKLKYDKINYVR